MNQVQTVKTICALCTNHCGMELQVRDGQILKVSGMPEHPFNHLCVKPHALQEMVYSEERVTTPLLKQNGSFKEISWEEAFDVIAERLTRIKNQFGAQAIVPFCGNGFSCRSNGKVIQRFAHLLGTPNFITGGWTCFSARVIAFTLTTGGFPNPDFSPENKCLILWGKNPPDSLASERYDLESALKRGSKLIVVDPRVTALAKKADLHAQLRPGTDCALALGLLNVIIGEELYDKKFTADWTVGFDPLVKQVREFSPEKVEKITWVPAETVRRIARMYAQNSPAAISPGWALDASSNGIQAMRAIAVMMAICGNLEVPGGNLIHRGLSLKHMNLPEKIDKAAKPIGTDFPIYTKIRKQQSGSRVTHAILTGKPFPIKALLVLEGNPMVNWPNTNKVREAFEKLDFLLVQDMFLTDTAKMAHLFLPAASDLEVEDLREGYFDHACLPMIAKSNKVIEPVGKSMEDWRIWAEVGKRMGFAEYFPWKNTSEFLAELVEPTQITYEDLKKNPGGVHYSPKGYRTYLQGGFKTPSGKVEIYSETLAEQGYDPLPTFHEPKESPVSRPDLAEIYPLILTGKRTESFTHSRFRNIPTLRKMYPEPLLDIHPRTAQTLGVKNGDFVRVESPRGSIRVKANFTDMLLPQVVCMTHGWSNESGANVNCLTDDQAVDPISSFPEFRSLLCRVVKE